MESTSSQASSQIEPLGLDMKIGFGTFSGFEYNAIEDKKERQKKAKESIICALQTYYRLYDMCISYGDVENIFQKRVDVNEIMGDALIESKAVRENIFLIGKGDHYDDIEKTIRDIFKCDPAEVGTGKFYLDMFMWHHARNFTNDKDFLFLESIFEAKKQGLIRHVGLSGIYIQSLKIIKDSQPHLLPYAIEIEVHLYCQEEETVAFCKENNIKVIAQSPLGYNWHEALAHDIIVTQMARKYRISPYTLLLAYTVSRDIIPIPCSSNESHIRENFSCLDVSLSPEDLVILSNCNTNATITLTSESAKERALAVNNETKCGVDSSSGSGIASEGISSSSFAIKRQRRNDGSSSSSSGGAGI